jgi:hypothetical protein
MVEQGGCCAICGDPPTTRPVGKSRTEVAVLHVDHDHDTGAIRQLVCNACNMGIGKLKDCPTVLGAALRYLHKHGKALSTDELRLLLDDLLR